MDWCEFTFLASTNNNWRSPVFPGSMLRGAFGHSLKQIVCVMRNRGCEGCQLEYSCIYTQMFETRPHKNKNIMRKYTRIPHPFVLVVDMVADRTTTGILSFGIRLFGEAGRYSPFCIRAFHNALARGLSRNKDKFTLDTIIAGGKRYQISQGDEYPPPVIQSAPTALSRKVRFLLRTPLRLASGGKLMTPESFDASVFVAAAVRRYGLLNQFYGYAEQPDFKLLKKECMKVKLLSSSLEWTKLMRYSSRQNKLNSMGGLCGTIELDIGSSSELGSILAWLPIINLGKATSMGLGRVEVD